MARITASRHKQPAAGRSIRQSAPQSGRLPGGRRQYISTRQQKRLHPSGRRQNAGCRDRRPLGRSARAGDAQADSRTHDQNSSAQRRDHGTADARGYDGRRDQFRPTYSTVLGDGVRGLSRLMKKITTIAGAARTKLAHRPRGTHQRRQTPAWPRAVPPSGIRRDRALGRF